MTPQFRLTEPAIRDIEQIADYIARESGLAQADRFLTGLMQNLPKSLNFPISDDSAAKSYLDCVVFQWIDTSFSTYQQIRM